MTHIDRPGHWERSGAEHGFIHPARRGVLPEVGAADSAFINPVPRSFVPIGGILIAATANKFEELLVGYVMNIDLKLRDVHRLRGIFVVPSEFA